MEVVYVPKLTKAEREAIINTIEYHLRNAGEKKVVESEEWMRDKYAFIHGRRPFPLHKYIYSFYKEKEWIEP